MAIEGLTQGEQVLNARRVFGEPIQSDGTLIIPTAKVRGGAGGGTGPVAGESSRPSGEGGGFGVTARPAGVYVVHGDKVRWIPSVDVNRIIAGAQFVAGCALIAWGLSRRGARSRWRLR